MLDLKFIRDNPDLVKQACAAKNAKGVDIDGILRLDGEKRKLQTEGEALKAELNKGSQEVGRLKKEKKDAEAGVRMTANRELGDRIKGFEEKLRAVDADLQAALAWVPNIPAKDVPIATDPSGNRTVRTWGKRAAFDFTPKAHWDLATELSLIDFEAGTRVAGSNFIVWTGAGALLQRALINLMLDLHTRDHGYTEVSPPALANAASMFGTGQLPKMEDDMYKIDRDTLYPIPTAEVPVTNLHREQTLAAKDLPRKYVAYTPCFRREAGAYGKDTRGLLRVHQFDKVELVKLVHPSTTYDELELLVKNAETVLQWLGLEYRVVLMCSGDMSFAAAKAYDLEAYAPGVDRWLEVSSCSTFEDFQARRMNLRFRDADGKVKHVHTMNGSGTALPRVVACLLETYQRKDGSVEIPDCLRPYMGGLTELTPVKSQTTNPKSQ